MAKFLTVAVASSSPCLISTSEGWSDSDHTKIRYFGEIVFQCS